MKKILCLFLAVIMLVCLSGCFGGTNTDDVRGDIVNDNADGIISENSNQDATEPEFSLGKAINNTYNNDFLGLSCTLPAGWEFYTDEQILELNNIVDDVVDEDVAERLKNANIIYDMYATCQEEGSNMNVNLEKFSPAQLISLNIKQTLESQIDVIKSSYAKMGYTDTNVEYQKMIVDGKEFDGLRLTAKIQGVDFYADIFSFRKSNYLVSVSICSIQTDKTDTILSYFTVE